MRIKKLKINRNILSYITLAAIIAGTVGISGVYYLHSNQEQVIENNIDMNNTFEDELGNIYCEFLPGEHVIKISRNDAYYHKIEQVKGYMIKEVEIKGWRDNNTVEYVNIEPVIAKATSSKKGKLNFNEFGQVKQQENEITNKTYQK